MAKIEMFLQDGQNLGYIKIRNGKPYYDYVLAKISQNQNLEISFQIWERFFVFFLETL